MQHIRLTGFLLHARPYREKQSIYQLFSEQYGVVHGVGSRGVPLFVKIELFATGQQSLKNFSQIHIMSATSMSQLGQNQYALLYLNELLYKLIAPENPCPALYQAYHNSIEILQNNSSMLIMKKTLRQFETTLFDELGASIDWKTDCRGQIIDVHFFYEFIPTQGFVKSEDGIQGEMILMIANGQEFMEKLTVIGQIHRQLIDYLLDYEPLNSRKLWIEKLKYC